MYEAYADAFEVQYASPLKNISLTRDSQLVDLATRITCSNNCLFLVRVLTTSEYSVPSRLMLVPLDQLSFKGTLGDIMYCRTETASSGLCTPLSTLKTLHNRSDPTHAFAIMVNRYE